MTSVGRLALIAALIVVVLVVAEPRAVAGGFPTAPEFPTQSRKHWVGTPLSLRDLRGRVVLLDVWTFG